MIKYDLKIPGKTLGFRITKDDCEIFTTDIKGEKVTETFLEAGKKLVEREVIATQTQNTLIIDDGTNEAGIPGFPYKFRAQGDKILVSVDIYKSGYECKDCKGTGRIMSQCVCESTDRPGYKYDSMGVAIEPTRRDQTKCPVCKGDYLNLRINAVCSLCKGTGASLVIPDSAKSLPTTGVIVSVGSLVTNPELKNNTRVLFGAYTGVMIPTKAPGVVFKVLRDIEVLCIIKGGEDLAAFDFVMIDKDLT
jgi:co-chaperonin GroES (HSP10)